MKINLLRDTETLRYAAEELLKYITMMDESVSGEIVSGESCENAVNLGLLSDLGLSTEGVNDAMLDDVIDLKVDKLCGYIAGSNERSVLMGVYTLLKSGGCNWVRPGALGEYVPHFDMSSHSYAYRKKADYPFRGECIEGSVGYEHLRDTVYWLPKVNMNLFMIEQIVPYNYMSRWYTHLGSRTLPHDDIPYSEYCRLCKELERDIKRCGLQLHAMGHGALNEPFGIRHLVSGQEYNVSDEAKRAFALVNGKRELFLKSPFFTQLCMSAEWVQDKIINWLADYINENKHIDFLHFWLADANNNHCECEECKKHHPTDLYVQMLNKLDRRLTKDGSDAKIIFIIYNDTLWAPIKERINNPSRFIMTAACGTGKGYSAKRREGGVPKWERNNITFPGGQGLDLTLNFVDAWTPIFDGPKFIYEYYLYTSHFADPGYMTFSRRISEDVKTLSVTSFDGIMSDQTQRAYFPTALPNAILAETLFDTTTDTEQFIDKYMRDAFGDEYAVAKEYLEEISAHFDINALSQNTNVTAQDTGVADADSKKATIIGNTAVGDVIAKVPRIIEKFSSSIEKNLGRCDNCHKESWRILGYHTEYVRRLSEIYYALSRNEIKRASELLDSMMLYISEVEMDIQPYFDPVLFERRTRQIIAGK